MPLGETDNSEKEYRVSVIHGNVGLPEQTVKHIAEECYMSSHLDLYNGTVEYFFKTATNATAFADIMSSHLKKRRV